MKSKELEMVLEREKKTSEAKSLFLAKMSHEIRTPMNGIIGISSLLAETELNKDQKELLDILSKSSQSLMSILKDTLDFSKFGSENFKINSAPFELEESLKEVINLFSASAREKKLNLKYIIGEGVPKFLLGDITRIQQILINLISNAIKFTETGQITISVEENPVGDNTHEIQFKVADTGIGISEENQKKLFDPFYQVEEGKDRKFEGAGLGLSICYKLVHLIKGKIFFQSKISKGSSFTFIIPLRSFGEEVLPKSHFKADESTFRELKEELSESLEILIVEDNLTNQRIIKKMCDKLGHHCEVAKNGKVALDILEKREKEPFSVILMDLQMPVMDGLTATKKIIEKYGDDRPKIFAITTNAYQEDREECLKVGMDGYLAKPFKKNELSLLLKDLKKK